MEREDLIERSLEFLNEFYKEEILSAVNEGKKSVEVDFSLLDKFDVELADYLLENPDEAISAMEEAVKQIDTGLSEAKIRLRFFNLPESRNIRIRNIRSEHIGKLIVVDGIVKRASEVRPEVSEAIFQCPECGKNISIIQTERFVRPPLECECGNRKGFKLVNQKLYDARWIMVEEPYEIVTGEKPSEMMIYLKEDLTSPKMQNKTDPGNRIKVVGILKEIPRRVKGSRSRQMDIFIDANHVESVEAVWEELEITPEDEKRIVELAKDPEVFNKLIASIAPTMYGLEDVKEAIILQLFGADPKLLKDKTRIRGNIHILLVGDPSSGKSQLMQLVSKLMPRGKYVSGSGLTAAGITATVVRDEEFLGGWVLEAGALVMANRSICCLHPSSSIIFKDQVFPISKLFNEEKSEKILCNGEIMEICKLNGVVPSFDFDYLRSSEHEATLVRRKKYSGKILRVKLDSGFETRLTPEHLLIDGNTLKWKRAGDFREGEYVLAPLKLQNKEEQILIFDLIPDDWKVCLNKNEKEEIKSEILKKHKNIAEFNRKLSLRKEILSGGCQPTLKQFKKIIKDLGVTEKWKIRSLKYGRTRLKIARVTPELGYVLGFVLGDGYLNRSEHHRGVRITQSVKHPEIIKKFIENWSKVFPKLHEYEDSRESNIRGRKVKSTSKVFYYGSNFLVLLYDKLVGRSLEKILSLPEEVLKSFVAGVFDSDGCISIKRSRKGGKEYKVAHVEILLGKDLRMNLNFMLALRKLGVYSKLIPTDKKVDIIRITGRRDVSLLKDSISKYSVKINVEIPERIHDVSSSSDKLPSFIVAEICRRIVKDVNTSLLNKYGLRMVYPYKNLKYQPSREEVKKLADKLGKELNPEIREEIVKLLQRDFFLDKIVEIKEEDYEGFVFDLFVPGANNFIADGIFVHNCIDEFSKVSPQDRVALMEAMSLETISIAKASIVATLPAQTAILAGGNPKLGRFDPYIPIREQVDIDDMLLSVDYKEPVLIREDGTIKIEKIGSFVNRYCKTASNNIVNLDGKVEVPALNLQTLKIEWWPVKYVFRHEINKPLLRLILETGREVKVTKGHSVYVFENGEIKPKRTDEIKTGDYVLIPRRLPQSVQQRREINLVKELLKLPGCLVNNVYIHNVPKEVFSRLKNVKKGWVNGGKLPVEFAHELTDEEIKNCYLKYKGASTKVPIFIPICKELMRLLGYYVAKGSMFVSKSKEHLISFALNRKEKAIVEDIRKISKKLFSHKTTFIKEGGDIKVNIANKIVYLLFKEVLKVKRGAENKEIPQIVFNVSPDLQKEFLKAYHLGDYGRTVSKKLASDLLYLSLQCGIIASVSFNKPHKTLFPDGHVSKGKASYTIEFKNTKWHSWIPLEAIKDFLKLTFQKKYKGYGEGEKYRFLTENWWEKVFLRKKRIKLLERLGLLQSWHTVNELTRKIYPEVKLESFRTKREWVRGYLNKLMENGFLIRRKVKGLYEYSLSEEGKEVLKRIRTVQLMFSSDLGFVKVKKIKEESPTNRYVYDISVPGHENFVAGFGGVICHNSRFDLKFALRDIPNPDLDSKIADHILKMRQYEEETKPLLEPEFIRKWIAYARARVHPALTPEAGNRLKEFYLEMRLKAGEEAPVAITLRQYEALLRLAEASARVRLSDKIELEDAERAIRLMKVSLRQFGFEPETGAIDIDRAEGARITSAQRSKIRIMLDVIEELGKTFGKEIPKDEIIRRAKEQNVDDAEDILRKMQYEGIVYSPRNGFISKV